MDEHKEYTVCDVIEITKNMLGNISVPVSMKNISDAIHNAMNNLQICIDAIKQQEGKENDGNDHA